MTNTTLGTLPTKPEHADRIDQEIKAALETLHETGVTYTFGESQETKGELYVKFAVGTAHQTIRIGRYEWTKPGVVNAKVVEHLGL
jgi:hypothetical protein